MHKRSASSRSLFDRRLELWGRATALPRPEPVHFVTVPPELGPAAEHLRLISDPELRVKLLAVGMAHVVQAPRGRQRMPTIIRLRPNLDGREQQASTPEKPTVEELKEVLERIAAEEARLVAASVAELDRRVAGLRSQFADAESEQLEALMSQVAVLLAARDDLRSRSRAEAIAALGADTTFPLRRFLPLIAAVPGQPASGAAKSARPAPPATPATPAPNAPAAAAPAPPAAAAGAGVSTARLAEREVYRQGWRDRLFPHLTRDWQGSGALAFKVRAKPKQVLEQLRYMAADGFIERRTARVADQVTRSRRVQKHKRRIEAQFRLRADLPAGSSPSGLAPDLPRMV